MLVTNVNAKAQMVKQIFLLVALALTTNAVGEMAFPETREAYDTKSRLNTYSPYLKYVLTIGRSEAPEQANRLSKNFEMLKQRNPEAAARFLKGLRVEMDHKLDIAALSPRSASTENNQMRRWVARFIKTWAQEAEESLFREIVLSTAQKRAAR